MKIILYGAITADGFIARTDGDSDWVSEVDSENWENEIQKAGCVIIGRTTFDQYKDELYPIPEVINIILTSDSSRKSENVNTIFVQSPEDAIKALKDRKLNSAVLTGGGKINGSFVKEGLVDELILTLHPMLFGQGINLLGDKPVNLKLQLLSEHKLDEELLRLHYKVIK